ncbi:FlgB family protein [Histidinibacterium lentulum]|nr:FlgB family protein [Histidinibacterium lentulum]
MHQTLDVFQTAAAMARHAGQRQAVVAQNIANADTPGYRARQIAPFVEVHGKLSATAMRSTRPGHLDPTDAAAGGSATRNTEPAPNGNAVSLEQEMLHAVEVAREHARALTIYRKSMEILRLSLGRR